jgi:hypothetical protein
MVIKRISALSGKHFFMKIDKSLVAVGSRTDAYDSL